MNDRRHELIFNAITEGLSEAGRFVALTEREAIARRVGDVLDEQRPQLHQVDPLTVRCSACLAPPGEPCIATSSDRPRKHPHRLRGLAAAGDLRRCPDCEGSAWAPSWAGATRADLVTCPVCDAALTAPCTEAGGERAELHVVRARAAELGVERCRGCGAVGWIPGEAVQAAEIERQVRVQTLRDLDAGAITAEDLTAAGLNPDHVVDLRDNGWTIQHPLTCRTDLFACPVNRAAERDLTGPPHEFGRFECGIEDGEFWIGEAR